MGVLDDMTKGIVDRKAKAAGPKLTPVGTEASGTKPSLMPKDLPGRFMAAEEVTDLARDLRDKAATLLAIADSLDQYTGEASAAVMDAKAAAIEAQKREEREADARVAAAKAAEPLPELDVDVDEAESFKERLDRLSAEAQAAAFAAADDTVGEPHEGNPNTPDVGWGCPDHGHDNLKKLTSRSGRQYMACQTSGCKHFEKP